MFNIIIFSSSPKTSMFDMIGHEDKILCVDWSLKDLMLTGSADNSYKMYKT
jgi:ribosome biogenesis protein